MTIATSESRAGFPAIIPVLLLLFAGTGCAALIYEIVWYQLLEFALGSTAVSLGVLLATFMGGLCIGSLALPRILRMLPEYWRHPMRLYATIETAIGVIGLLELLLIPLTARVYVAGAQSGLPGMLLRGFAAALCLLPPTILMGASLPALVRWFEASREGVSRWGLLYGGNTAGAVFGCLFAGFYLLRLYDVTVATFAAAGLNFGVAAIAWVLASRVPAEFSGTGLEPADAKAPSSFDDYPRWSIYAAIAFSGTCALGAQVVWTRLMGLMFGGTVYAFSIILAVFLFGLVIGTGAGSFLARRINPRLALAWSQVFAALGLAWAAYVVAEALPYWPIDPLLSTDPFVTFQIDLVRSFLAILPPTIFWGASFPFAFAAAASPVIDPARTVGTVYAANTFGAIFGALFASLVFIPWIGTQETQRLLLVLSLLGGLIALAPVLFRTRSEDLIAYAGSAAVACAILAWGIQAVPGELIAYGRRIAITAGRSEILETHEGRNASIAISRWNSDRSIQFHVSGKVEASTMASDMKLERMLGHLGALIHPGPQSVLIVGFGAGVTAGSFVPYPSVDRIVICELEPLIPPTSTRYFVAQNYNVMNDERTQIFYDDARHFVLTHQEKFDLITSDPIHPFVKGSAALYSREYFEMLKSHLNPGGVVTQWLPLYESDAATVKSQVATFFDVFPYVTAWANTMDGAGYDVVLIGHLEPPKIDLDAVQERLDRLDHAEVKRSMINVGLDDATALFGTYIGDKTSLAPWLTDAEINRDRNLRLQYLAGLALNNRLEDQIYREMIGHFLTPTETFVGSEQSISELFLRLANAPGMRRQEVNP
jgi:spermidine synthase